MPVSFYIFLLGSIVAFLPAYWDHGETWTEIKCAKKGEKRPKILKLIILWTIPISGLLGTIFLGVESIKGDKQDRQRDEAYAGVTNKLGQLEVKYEEATNDLIASKQAAAQATNAANSLNIEALNSRARHLTIAQKRALLAAILPFAKQKYAFDIIETIRDSDGFASDISSVFLADGWDIMPPRIYGQFLGNSFKDGVTVTGNEECGFIVKTVADAFTTFGYSGHAQTNDGIWQPGFFPAGPRPRFTNVIVIAIGEKPLN